MESDIRLLHRSVSRAHALLICRENLLTIRDLGSSNGTFVNGRRITHTTAEVGDLLQFGRVTAELRAEGQEGGDDGGEIETDVSRAITHAEAESRLSKFPPARRRVMELLGSGLSVKEVAAQLDVTEDTVHWHTKRIYKALQVHSRVELTACFLRLFTGHETVSCSNIEIA